jgi:hypothetical protein
MNAGYTFGNDPTSMVQHLLLTGMMHWMGKQVQSNIGFETRFGNNSFSLTAA